MGGYAGPGGLARAGDAGYGPAAGDGGFADAGAEEAIAAGDEEFFCGSGGFWGGHPGEWTRVW